MENSTEKFDDIEIKSKKQLREFMKEHDLSITPKDMIEAGYEWKDATIYLDDAIDTLNIKYGTNLTTNETLKIWKE